MALGGEVYDACYLMLADYAAHLVEIGDVGLHEGIIRLVLDVFQIGEIARIRQFVEVDNVVVGVFVDEEAHDVGTDEPGSAGNKYISHWFFSH